jgi:N6-L-threonylcarbamoyladenine synthase
MIILGIETSCDETAAALLDNGTLASNVISTQDIHTLYGGVVPEFASRAHQQHILPVLRRALDDAGLQLSEIDGIAVTYGPGLVGSIVVGLNVAKGMATGLNKPFIGINHMEGHIFANFIQEPSPEPPFLCLIISGGHTQLVLVETLGSYRILGGTIDDAAGEAFDKVSRTLGLGYPGGPAIEAAGADGDPEYVHFPRAMLEPGNFNFSFSGVKTSVLYYTNQLSSEEKKQNLHHLAASFEQAVVDVLVKKTFAAIEQYRIGQIALAGGVAANSRLRSAFLSAAEKKGIALFLPSRILCTDNAAMIAKAGQFYLEKGENSAFNLGPRPSLTL